MLCAATQKPGAAEHWKLEFNGMEADATRGKAHWESRYLFSATGRKVHNIIDGTFTFTHDGLIATHRDRFNFWRAVSPRLEVDARRRDRTSLPINCDR